MELFQFLHKLGVSEKWQLVDVFGLEDEALNWIPRPAVAFILLFPCSDKVSMSVEVRGIETEDFVFSFTNMQHNKNLSFNNKIKL